MTISSMPGLGEDDLRAEDRPPLRKTMSTLGRFIGLASEMTHGAGFRRRMLSGDHRRVVA